MAQSHKIAAEISNINIKIDGIEVYKAFLYMRQVTANATISILRLRMALCKRKGTVKSPFVLKDIARRCAKVAAFLCCTTVALAQPDSINFPVTIHGLTWDTTTGDARGVFRRAWCFHQAHLRTMTNFNHSLRRALGENTKHGENHSLRRALGENTKRGGKNQNHVPYFSQCNNPFFFCR